MFFLPEIDVCPRASMPEAPFPSCLLHDGSFFTERPATPHSAPFSSLATGTALRASRFFADIFLLRFLLTGLPGTPIYREAEERQRYPAFGRSYPQSFFRQGGV